ncbi:GGDEF domain-containing protein [Marinobacter sp. SS5-14b]|uniref:GGDEF domain-containing protein n=1 Tax=Marinobacter sp. SS5-14b TaxID=3050456 RepID=UPI0026DF6D12|nr:GGDEF domain-containing protein [Marinobacter sp. SS5-14b]
MNSLIPPESFIDLLLDAVCVVDREGQVLYVSAASERVFGYRPQDMVGQPILGFVHPEDQQKTRAAIMEIVQGELKPHFENRYLHKNGSVVHIMWSARWSDDKQVRVAVARDVTIRKQAEAMQSAMYAISEAANSATSLQAMLRRIHGVVDELLVAPAFVVALKDATSGAMTVLYNADRLENESFAFASDATALCERVARSARLELVQPDCLGVPLLTPEGVSGALLVQRHAGSSHFSDRDGDLLEFVGEQVAAAVARKQMHSQLEYMARHDQLTGLPNRHLVMDRIETALARAAREKSYLAILYLDVDKFKEVNDTYGHGAGDDVLELIARRLVQSVRASDTVGRLGGDEFIVLLDGLNHEDDVAGIVEKIATSLREPCVLSAATLNLVPSIGVAVYPEHGSDVDTLIRYADGAMYRVKKSRTG